MKFLLEFTKKLIQSPSISPLDLDCQKIIRKILISLGFIVKTIDFSDTKNTLAWKIGMKNSKSFAFSCHTDVVHPGNYSLWKFPPFKASIEGNYLYGRGVVDMKGAISSMIFALKNFLKKNPFHNEEILFFITSDEESKARFGTKKIVEYLIRKKKKIHYCLIGEPSSKFFVGDQIRIGRRGSLNIKIFVYGAQKHVAYSNGFENPYHKSIFFLKNFLNQEKFNFQIIDIKKEKNISNTHPEKIIIFINIRYESKVSVPKIKEMIEKALKYYRIKYQIYLENSSKPFESKKGKFLNKVKNSIKKVQKFLPQINNSGGTSDGRFIRKLNCQIVELGLQNATIHQINERVRLDDLLSLSLIYEEILNNTVL
ncbi:succinyl-diaminopimelate desuccinylase [bacterium endosymbiont of Pedicinus badii]|uniref:succinyl-diaminopimelate desuccinylase n=1 Tax=bacterium endosymbiont of Pedicinus badii TaxID=1719126 RepID=UPI0009BAFC65|nr:succinyl-diaminopimelate desuccinylase [bacterium endosymbiont of Pedicinus badii]OQM34474.1 hypothetical protein AOQ89_01130 [bacterium endosymbiont of Pedicinus badii]